MRKWSIIILSPLFMAACSILSPFPASPAQPPTASTNSQAAATSTSLTSSGEYPADEEYPADNGYPADEGYPADNAYPANVNYSNSLTSPTGTEPPGNGTYSFAGSCSEAEDATQPCIYVTGIDEYNGEKVFRYVFENIPYPDTFFVEINGTPLECVYLPEFSTTRAYCMGNTPYKKPLQMRMGWKTPSGEIVEVYIDSELLQRLNNEYKLPMGKPPKPTRTPVPPTPEPQEEEEEPAMIVPPPSYP